MGRELAERSGAARRVFESADEALGFSISELCFDGPDEDLRLTANSQPALLTLSVALLRVIGEETEVAPDVAAGHSLGEYSALVCAGALSFEDAVRAVRARGRYMQEAVPAGLGTMAAVMGLSPEQVEEVCREAAGDRVLVPANYNGGGQIVIAGHTEAVARALDLVDERGGVAKELAVSAPFHSPLMEPVAERLRRDLERISFSDPKIPVIANVDAEANRDGSKLVDLLTRQVTSPVRWEASVKKMAELGVTEVVEVGPGRVLSSLIRRIDRGLKTKTCGKPEQIGRL